MKMKLILGIISCLFLSCSKTEVKQKRVFKPENLKNYTVVFSNLDYHFDLNSGIIESDNFKVKDSIVLTKNEREKIAKLFFENYIDTITTETYVNVEVPSIMPDVRENSIKVNNKIITIYGLPDSLKVNEMERNVIRFKEKTFHILKQNKQFNKALNDIKSMPKDWVFL